MVKPKSFHLQWHITERCNFKCKHCYTEKPMNELSTDELFLILDQYIEMIKRWKMDINNRPRLLSISGGEPLLRKDIFELLEAINENKDMFTNVVLMSNGSTITDNVIKKLKDLGIPQIQISLDGLEKNNDKIRGNGNFKKAVKGMKRLVEERIPVGISMTVHKGNVNDIEGLISFCRDIGVKSLGVSRLVPIGRGKDLRILDPLETKEFYKKLINLKDIWKERGVYIHTHCSDPLWFIEDPGHQTHGCSVGYDSFSILPNGDVVPCRRLPIKVGNVLENTLFDIWYNSKILWDLRNREMINETCKKCELFEKCYGGAKCIANGYFGSPFAPDPQCWKMFKKLPNPTRLARIKSSKNFVLDHKYIEAF